MPSTMVSFPYCNLDSIRRRIINCRPRQGHCCTTDDMWTSSGHRRGLWRTRMNIRVRLYWPFPKLTHCRLWAYTTVWLICVIFSPVLAQVSSGLGDNAGVPEQRVPPEANVICASNSITGQFKFSTPFSGKVYSARYANIQDCVYYNSQSETMVVFTVPNYKCGTIVQRNSQNIISHIENEVYVQFDKETQNVEDRRYLFICDRVDYAPTSPYPYPYPATYRGTLQPGQTVIVQTIEPTQIIATSNYSLPPTGSELNSAGPNPLQPYVWMEIQDGLGPRKPPVQRPLHLGDQVTLVVTGRSFNNGNQYDMFVHSCFASDGSGQNKIQLSDSAGCALKSTIAEKMMRVKNATEVTYFMPIKAFKFPSSDDVYFSCSVEICSTCNFPELCPTGQAATNRSRRKTPSLTVLRYDNDEESIQVHDYVKIVDNTDIQALRRDTQNGRNDLYSSGCFDRSVVIVLLTIIAALLAALICTAVYVICLLRQRK